MSDITISASQAKQDKLFYIVANIIIIDRVKQACLLLKRSEKEKVHPGKWAFPGGKLEHGELQQLLEQSGKTPIDGIDNILGILAAREAEEECGLIVDVNAKILQNKVFIRPDNVPVFLAILVTEYRGGTVALEDGAITDHAWVTKEELSNYDCIPGIVEEAEEAFLL